jgi:hypothetical protein
MTKIETKVSGIEISQLKEMAAILSNDMQDGAEIVYASVLNELMARMPENEFVAFCDGLD